MCVTLDISVLMVRFGDRARVRRVDTLRAIQERTRHPSTKVSWLFDKLSDNNASDNGLSLSASVAVNKQIPEVIPMPANDAIFVVYQSNVRYNTYAYDSAFHHIN